MSSAAGRGRGARGPSSGRGGRGGRGRGRRGTSGVSNANPYPGLKIPEEITAFRNWEVVQGLGEQSIQEPGPILQFLATRLKSVLTGYAQRTVTALRHRATRNF